MKKCLIIICISLLFSCKENNNNNNNNNNNTTDIEAVSLEGAWELTSYLNYKEDGSVDTIKSSNSFKQIKMFSKTKIMWSRLRTTDSLDWFGVGNYSFKDGILTEFLDYGSKAMNNRLESSKKFIFNTKLNKNEFTQIQIDSIGRPIYAETYLKIE